MAWNKLGLIYCPPGDQVWARHSFMTPTPFDLDSETVRLYGGFRDDAGVSRIGFIDVKKSDPSTVVGVSDRPVLDTGAPGAFDDNGVILGDVLRCGDHIRMYYVGFQLVHNVKFMAFTGLAVSHDNGSSFRRVTHVPILDRSETSPNIRAIHSVLYDEGVYKVWYAIGKGSGWRYIDGRPYPSYNIWYTESNDGIHFPRTDEHLCIDTVGSEYRIGRPRVYKDGGIYKMYYTRDFIERNYVAGYAESLNGRDWERKDRDLGIAKSPSGWDSEMICYPVLFAAAGKRYMIYSGNGFGRTGVGLALWED